MLKKKRGPDFGPPRQFRQIGASCPSGKLPAPAAEKIKHPHPIFNPKITKMPLYPSKTLHFFFFPIFPSPLSFLPDGETDPLHLPFFKIFQIFTINLHLNLFFFN